MTAADVFKEAGIDMNTERNKRVNIEAFYVDNYGHEKELVEARESWNRCR